MKEIQLGQNQILNPEKWRTKEPKYKSEPKPRITIYCYDDKQKENISSKLATLKNRYGVKNNADVIEHLVGEEIKFLKRYE